MLEKCGGLNKLRSNKAYGHQTAPLLCRSAFWHRWFAAIGIKLVYSWFRALVLTRKGIGPFSSRTLAAMRSNTCMRCGLSINDLSLFGNSLVVEPGQVVLICRRCRASSNSPSHVHQSFGRAKISSAICQIKKRTDMHSEAVLDWFEVLVCLRMGYAYFQRGYHRPREAFIKRPYKDIFGNLFAIGNCGECGAFWTNDYHKNKPLDSYSQNRAWSWESCWHCGLRHELQWHMRMSADEERQQLFLTITNV